MKRETKFILAAVVIVVVVVALVAVYPTLFPAPKEKIKLGVIVALTGPMAYASENMVQGMRLAVEEINENGGVLGRELELVVYDDKADPKESVSALRRLLDEDKVTIVLGTVHSSGTLAMMPITQERKILHITQCTAPAITKSGHPYIFRVLTTSAVQYPGWVDWIMKNLNLKTFCALAVNNDWGMASLHDLIDSVEERGGTILSSDTFSFGTTDFYPVLTKYKSLKPDAVYVGAYPAQCIDILTQYRELKIPSLLTTDGFMADIPVREACGEMVNGLYYCEVWESSESPATRAFNETIYEKFGRSAERTQMCGWFEVMVAYYGIKGAGTYTDVDKMASALHGIEFESMKGTVTIDEFGDLHYPQLVMVIEDQKPKFLATYLG